MSILESPLCWGCSHRVCRMMDEGVRAQRFFDIVTRWRQVEHLALPQQALDLTKRGRWSTTRWDQPDWISRTDRRNTKHSRAYPHCSLIGFSILQDIFSTFLEHVFLQFVHRVVNAQVDDAGLFRSEEPHHNVGRIEAQARIAEKASKLITFFDLCGHERRVGQWTVFFFSKSFVLPID